MPAKIAIGLLFLFLVNPIGLYGQIGSTHYDRFDVAVSELDEGNYKEALNRFETLREKSCGQQGYQELCLDSKIYLMITLRRLNQFENAKQVLDQAEQFGHDELNGHPDYMAIIYLYRIYMDEELPDFENIDHYIKKSREILDMEDVKPATTLMAAVGVGYHEDASGNYQTAIDLYKTGLEAVKGEKHDKTTGRILIQSYNNLGVSYRRLGMAEKAMEMYQMSVDKINSVHGTGHLSLTFTYNNIGTVYYGMGDFGRAAEYFLRSAAIIEEKLGKNNPRMGTALNNAGVSMQQLGNYDKAAQYLEEAQRVKKAVQGENIDIAVGYSNLASLHILNKAYDEAERNYLRSIRVRKNIEGNNHPILIEPKIQLAGFYLDRERHEDARAQLARALQIGLSRLGPSHPSVSDIYYTFGKSYEQQGLLPEALEYFRTALATVYGEYNLTESPEPERVISAPLKFVNILKSKAKVYRYLYESNSEADYLYKALNCLQWSVEMVDYLQMSYQNEASKLNLIDSNYSIYTEIAEIHYELYQQNRDPYNMDQIFTVMEESRARIAQELLQNVTAQSFAGVPDEIIGQERQLNSAITHFYQQLGHEKNKGLEKNREMVSNLQDSLFYARRELEMFTSNLEASYPSYYKLKYDRRVIEKERAKEMLGPNHALLSYMITDKQIYLFLLSAEHSKFIKLSGTEGLQNRIINLRKAVTAGITDDYTRLSHELYVDLVEPVKPYLTTESLIIVADQMLHLLPFELLLTEQTDHTQYRNMPYLIRDYSISYAPSVSILEMMKNRKQESPRNLLALAPFAQQPEAETVLANFERNGSDLEPLLLTNYETRKIGEIFRERRTLSEYLFPNRTEILINNKATKTELLNRLGNFNFLHFATHAFINEENPAMSGIALYPEPGNNGIAYLGDIFNMQMNADLVVLGACDTGLGSVYKGEGMIGFARAFIYAGAANLAVSLWRVNDQPTALLMIDFYGQIRNGYTYQESLRQAKLTMIENPATAAPRNWAAFVLHGR